MQLESWSTRKHMTQNATDVFKQRDAQSYDAVTDSFDHYTELFSSAAAARICDLAGLGAAAQVLDIGSGSGVVTLEAAGRLSDGGLVTGVDLSDGMLEFAGRKARERALDGRVRFTRMDAEALEFSDRSFDAVLSLYALRHFPDPRRALHEMRRVLRPGGTVVVGVGSGPMLFSSQGLRQAWRRVLDVPQRLTSRQLLACQFIEDLVEKHLPARDRSEEADWLHHTPSMTGSVPGMVRDAGFKDVQIDWVGHRAALRSPEEFWNVQMTFSSLARKRVAAATPERVAVLRAEFDRASAAVLARGGSLLYQTGALIVRGRAP